MKKIIIAGLLFCTSIIASGYSQKNIERDLNKLFTIVSETQELSIEGVTYELDVRELLEMTLQVESRYGKDKYTGRYAKTPFQYEEPTTKHYMKIMPELKKHIEYKIGRKLNMYKDSDSVFVAYIVYMGKIRYHKNWLDKYAKTYFRKSGDLEWLVYKVLWNSVKGQSTYTVFKRRRLELIQMKITRYIK